MAQRNIFVWSGHNYALEAAKALGIDGAVRIGAVHYNSVGEIDTVLEALEQLLT
jgi:selenocysteine lyase/cysteine desulfurase